MAVMPPKRDTDALDQLFWEKAVSPSNGTVYKKTLVDAVGVGESKDVGDNNGSGSKRAPEDGRKLFAAGSRHGMLEVLGLSGEVKVSSLGRTLSPRTYRVKCHGCSQERRYNYQQLYNGGQIKLHCGCQPDYKKPPVRNEDKHFGRLLVIEWDRQIGQWHCVCTECGAELYRRTNAELRKDGRSCETHKTLQSPLLIL
jgi:hypothetical protein